MYPIALCRVKHNHRALCLSEVDSKMRTRYVGAICIDMQLDNAVCATRSSMYAAHML
jgi:hypothetical protein